jgi:O-antigen/teichoic acid export membrane protein
MSAVSNARWIAAAQAAKVALQFVSVAVLARLLTPNDYGLIAMVFAVGNLVALLRDMGTAAAIVQDPQLTEETKNAVFWINVALGVVLCIALIASSGLIANAFRSDAVMPLLWALAPSFPISSVGAVPRALLERRSAFAIIARIEISSALLGLIVTATSAWLGAGAMSFIYGSLAMASFSSLAFWRSSQWMPSKVGRSDRLGKLLTFSGNLSAFNFINYFARNADSFVIGRYLGAAALGIYSNAYKVMLFPLQNMTYVANRALYPVMCRQESIAEMRTLYLKSVSVIVIITAPMMAGIFVLREPFIDTFLGAKWHEAASVLQWLAPVGFVQSIVSTTGTVSMVRGRTDVLLRIGILASVLQVSAFFIGVKWGIMGVAACYFVANFVGAIPAMIVALRQLDSTLGELMKETWAAIVAALLMAVSVWAVDGVLDRASYSDVVRLVVGVAIGVAVYAGLILVLAPSKVRLVFTLVPARFRT